MSGPGAQNPALLRARVVLSLALLVLIVWVITGNPSSGIPARVAEGAWLRPKDYWRTFGWYFALGNALGVAALLATARHWVGQGPPAGIPTLAPPRSLRCGFAVVATTAVLLGAGLAAPRLGQSFWDDEDRNLRQSIDGSWVPDGSGSYRGPHLSWKDTLRYYHDPSNHVLHSLLAKGSIETWRAVAGRDAPFVSEVATRLPAFLAGVGALAVLAVLLAQLGHPVAGCFAALVLAIHPWWIRYASEARGYSLAVLLVPTCLLLLVRVLHRGSWPRWIAYGAAQLALLWTLPSLVFQVAMTNLAALGLLWRGHRGTPALAQQGQRLIVANIASGLIFLQLMGPNFAQLGEYLERTRATRDLGIQWLSQEGSYLLAGMAWRHTGLRGSDPVYPELIDVFQATPLALVVLVVVTLLGITAGVVRMVRAGGLHAWLPVLLLAPPILSYVVARLRADALYQWYLLYALPGLVALLALGFEGLVLRPRRAPARMVLGTLLLGGFLMTQAVLTSPVRRALRTRSFKPARESVALTRSERHPLAPENERILTVELADRKVYYDPRLQALDRLADLERVMAEADATGKALFVNTGRLWHNRRHRPEIFALLDDPTRFELVAELPAVEPPWTRRVWRYVGTEGASPRD